MKRTPSDFEWKPNGTEHINCPGGFVIANYDPDIPFLQRMYNPQKTARRWVLYFGKCIQVCTSLNSAKEFVVATMKSIHDEYRVLPRAARKKRSNRK